jgi:hypothetical protein
MAPFSRSTLQGRYLSRQYADDENRQPIADFVVIDASIHKPLAKGIRMFLNGENLTNRRYIATQTGVRPSGRTLLHYWRLCVPGERDPGTCRRLHLRGLL